MNNLIRLMTVVAFLILQSCITGDGTTKLEFIGDRGTTSSASSTPIGNAVVTNITLNGSNELVITGSSLNIVDSVKITGPSSYNQSFQIKSKTATQLIIGANTTFAVNALLNLIFTNATGAATHTINFAIPDASIVGAKIATATIGIDKLDGSALSSGEFLKWNGSNFVSEAIAASQVMLGDWNADSNRTSTSSFTQAIADNCAYDGGTANNGEYFVVTTADPAQPIDGISTWAVNDWIMCSSSNWIKITKSSISDVADVDTSGVSSGSILFFNNSNSRWEATNEVSVTVGTVVEFANDVKVGNLAGGGTRCIQVDNNGQLQAASCASASTGIDGGSGGSVSATSGDVTVVAAANKTVTTSVGGSTIVQVDQTGMSLNGFAISNVATPTSDQDVANKGYVDAALAVAGADDLGNHTATQALDLAGNNITNPGLIGGVDINSVTTNSTQLGTHSISISANQTAIVNNDIDIAALQNTMSINTLLLGTRTLSTVAPNTGQVLKWNGSEWLPGNDNAGGAGGGIVWTATGAEQIHSSRLTATNNSISALDQSITNNISSIGVLDLSTSANTTDINTLKAAGSWSKTGNHVYINTGNVGIGSTNPNVYLDVAGAISSTVAIGAPEVCLGGDCRTAWPSGGGGGVNHWTKTSNDIHYTSGLVGIGLASPEAALDISGTSPKATSSAGEAAELLVLRDNRTTAGAAANYVMSINRQNSNVAAWYFGNDGNADGIIAVNNQNLRIGYDTAGTFTETIRIDTNGRMGIGDTSPDVSFAIEGTSGAATTGTPELFTIRDNRTTTTTAANYVFAINRQNSDTPALNFGNDGNADAIIAANNANLRFGYDVGGTFNESLRITNAGKVGIGSNNPTALFEVAGEISSTVAIGAPEVCLAGDCRTAWPSGGTSSYWTKTVSDVYFTGGSVGIGTNNPEGSLAVHKNTATAYSNSVTPNVADLPLVIRNDNAHVSGGVQTGIQFNLKGDGQNRVNYIGIVSDNGTDRKASFVFHTDDDSARAERMRIKYDGNVGIGSIDPTAKLDVTGNVIASGSISATSFVGDGSSLTGVTAVPAGSDKQILFNDGGVEAGDSNFTWDKTAKRLHIVGTTTQSLYIGNNSGNGTTTTGNSNTAIGLNTLQNATSASGNTVIGDQALANITTGKDNTALGRNASLANDTAWYTIGIGALALYSNQSGNNNIAIGNSALRNVVSTASNVAIGHEAGKNTTGSGNIFIGTQAGENEGGSNKLYIDNNNTATPLIGGDFASDEVYLNGNVGVGTTTVTSKLHVNGRVIASTVKYEWTDTVVGSNGQTLTSLDNITLDTSGGTYSLNLPASPANGDVIRFVHVGGTLSTNNVVIYAAPGHTIVGDPNLIIDMDNVSIDLLFHNNDWRLR